MNLNVQVERHNHYDNDVLNWKRVLFFLNFFLKQ